MQLNSTRVIQYRRLYVCVTWIFCSVSRTIYRRKSREFYFASGSFTSLSMPFRWNRGASQLAPNMCPQCTGWWNYMQKFSFGIAYHTRCIITLGMETSRARYDSVSLNIALNCLVNVIWINWRMVWLNRLKDEPCPYTTKRCDLLLSRAPAKMCPECGALPFSLKEILSDHDNGCGGNLWFSKKKICQASRDALLRSAGFFGHIWRLENRILWTRFLGD